MEKIDRRRLWDAKNPEKKKAINAAYSKNNRAIKNSLEAKREAAKIQRTPTWLTKNQLVEISEFYKMAKQLESIFSWKQHVDHIVPLQGKTVSGLHVPWNLQILSASENIKKNNKYGV